MNNKLALCVESLETSEIGDQSATAQETPTNLWRNLKVPRNAGWEWLMDNSQVIGLRIGKGYYIGWRSWEVGMRFLKASVWQSMLAILACENKYIYICIFFFISYQIVKKQIVFLETLLNHESPAAGRSWLLFIHCDWLNSDVIGSLPWAFGDSSGGTNGARPRTKQWHTCGRWVLRPTCCDATCVHYNVIQVFKTSKAHIYKNIQMIVIF